MFSSTFYRQSSTYVKTNDKKSQQRVTTASKLNMIEPQNTSECLSTQSVYKEMEIYI